MSDWQEMPLSRLASFQKGRKVDTSPFPREGFQRYLGASGLAGGGDGYANEKSAVIAKCSDTLMLWDGERSGLVGYGQEGVVASTVSKLSPLEFVHPKYLYFALASHFDWIQHRRTGTGVPHVPKDLGRILKLRLPLSVRVQERIAAVLSCIDTAIKKTEALIAKHQQIKVGLTYDLFARGVLPNGRLRQPRSEAPELYQETAAGWIPMGWKPSTLRQCLTESPTNGIYKPPGMIGEGMLMVGQTAFTEQRSIDFDLCRRGDVSKEEAQRFGLAKDDILVTRVFATIEGVGLPTLVPKLIEPAVFESNMMRLRIDASIIKPRLLFEWLQSPIARRHITGGANASNQCSVNQGVLNPLPVGLPPQEEQRRITAGIELADRQRLEVIESLSKLKMQKLGLMQDLLIGRVSVEHLVPELADA
jgi:type I restriction enzyme, S subunit